MLDKEESNDGDADGTRIEIKIYVRQARCPCSRICADGSTAPSRTGIGRPRRRWRSSAALCRGCLSLRPCPESLDPAMIPGDKENYCKQLS